MNINADWKIKQNSDVLQGGSGTKRQELLNKAKPIFFNTEMMVEAMLDNKKTEARRVVEFQGTKNPNWTGYVKDGLNLYNGNNEICNEKLPYKIGDILYVCESIHMPKEAARIFLRVKDVKVERLHDIVTGDYKTPLNINAEGMYKPCCNCTHVNGDCKDFISQNDCKLLSEFKNLWDSTIKKPDIDRYGWKANPWVWVIEFNRITEEMK